MQKHSLLCSYVSDVGCEEGRRLGTNREAEERQILLMSPSRHSAPATRHHLHPPRGRRLRFIPKIMKLPNSQKSDDKLWAKT